MRAICEGQVEEKLRVKAAAAGCARTAARKVEVNIFARRAIVGSGKNIWAGPLGGGEFGVSDCSDAGEWGCLLTKGRDVDAAVRPIQTLLFWAWTINGMVA